MKEALLYPGMPKPVDIPQVATGPTSRPLTAAETTDANSRLKGRNRTPTLLSAQKPTPALLALGDTEKMGG